VAGTVLASARALKVGFNALPVAIAVPAAAEAFTKVLLESFTSSKKCFNVLLMVSFSSCRIAPFLRVT
jgi:hypothetical protein